VTYAEAAVATEIGSGTGGDCQRWLCCNEKGGGLGHCWKRLCQVLMTKRSFGDGTEALVIDTELMCFHNT
jgi:hypothetical protein